MEKMVGRGAIGGISGFLVVKLMSTSGMPAGIHGMVQGIIFLLCFVSLFRIGLFLVWLIFLWVVPQSFDLLPIQCHPAAIVALLLVLLMPLCQKAARLRIDFGTVVAMEFRASSEGIACICHAHPSLSIDKCALNYR